MSRNPRIRGRRPGRRICFGHCSVVPAGSVGEGTSPQDAASGVRPHERCLAADQSRYRRSSFDSQAAARVPSTTVTPIMMVSAMITVVTFVGAALLAANRTSALLHRCRYLRGARDTHCFHRPARARQLESHACHPVYVRNSDQHHLSTVRSPRISPNGSRRRSEQRVMASDTVWRLLFQLSTRSTSPACRESSANSLRCRFWRWSVESWSRWAQHSARRPAMSTCRSKRNV